MKFAFAVLAIALSLVAGVEYIQINSLQKDLDVSRAETEVAVKAARDLADSNINLDQAGRVWRKVAMLYAGLYHDHKNSCTGSSL